MIAEASDLPFIDEHHRHIAAAPEVVWQAARDIAAHSTDRLPRALVRAWGLRPDRMDGPRPLDAGSTVPGFRVSEATPGHRLVLDGGHRFARYRLEFMVDAAPGGSLVTARSYAEFPGPAGVVYRRLVIGTRGHVLAVRRLLGRIEQRAVRQP